jgi:hypothetical protein
MNLITNDKKAISVLQDMVKEKESRIMELEVILDDTRIFLKTIGTLRPLVVDNCKKLLKKIEDASI